MGTGSFTSVVLVEHYFLSLHDPINSHTGHRTWQVGCLNCASAKQDDVGRAF